MLKVALALLTAGALAGASFWLEKAETDAAVSKPDAVRITPQTNPENPVELGRVHWMRSLDSGLVRAKALDRPILILFQEVPGCGNCTRYGSGTLSHPLIVEAVESLFVPVCIYNNQKGDDARALQRFGEPAWNNPVVRIVNAEGADLTPRMADFRSSFQLINGMMAALESRGCAPPEYLRLLALELSAREYGLDTATFQMYCFWSGEATLGSIEGVVETRPGFQDGHEVVRVAYDPRKTSRAVLTAAVTPKGITACSKNGDFRNDNEPKYYLAQTDWKSVPMTTLQAARANSLVGQHLSPESVLSKRQIEIYQKMLRLPPQRRPNYIGVTDLVNAWSQIQL